MDRSYIEVSATGEADAAGVAKQITGEKTGFLSHLYIKVVILPRQARDKHRESSKKARFVADHVNWDRYLSLIQGRTAFAPIKFNGQAFNCNNTGQKHCPF
jgi:hypothetical protein